MTHRNTLIGSAVLAAALLAGACGKKAKKPDTLPTNDSGSLPATNTPTTTTTPTPDPADPCNPCNPGTSTTTP